MNRLKIKMEPLKYDPKVLVYDQNYNKAHISNS